MLCTNATMHGYAITAQYVADSSISEMYCVVIDVLCGFVTVIFYHLPTWRDIYQDNALQTTLNVKKQFKKCQRSKKYCRFGLLQNCPTTQQCACQCLLTGPVYLPDILYN